MAVSQEAASGWYATRLLLAVRWRMMRTPGSRAMAYIGAIFFVLALVLVANLGYVAQIAAQQPDTAQGIFARTWVYSLRYGYMVNIGTFAIGGAVIAALFAPFTGTSTLALAPTEDLHGLRLPRLHRYFGAWIINGASGLGLLQLLVLTGVASLITMDGYRVPGLFFALSVWVLLITLMTTLGWLLEVVVRKTTPRMRVLLGLLTAAALAALYLSDQRNSGRLFGLSDSFTHAIREGVRGWTLQTVLLPVAMIGAAFLVGVAGILLTRFALTLPVPPAAARITLILTPLSSRPRRAVRQLLLRTLLRTKEVRRPLIALVLIGAGLSAALEMSTDLELSIVAAVALAVALSWGVNVYGLLGTGMIWLGAQPQVLNRLPGVAARMQLAITGLLLGVFFGVSLLFGRADITDALPILTAGAIAAVTTTALSSFLSIARPHRARMSGRGDALLPPLTALAYMFALIVAGPLPAAWFLSAPDQQTAWFIAIGSLVLSASLFAIAWRRWRNPHHRARLISTVSAA